MVSAGVASLAVVLTLADDGGFFLAFLDGRASCGLPFWELGLGRLFVLPFLAAWFVRVILKQGRRVSMNESADSAI